MKSRCFFVLILLTCCACEREVNLIPPYPGDRPVMNALLTPDSPFWVWLTQTIPTLTPSEPDSIPRITDARVWVLVDGDTLARLMHSGGGYYRAADSLRPQVGRHYRFVAQLAEGALVSHEPVRMPAAISGEVLGYERDAITLSFNGETRDRLRMTFDDPPGMGQVYEVRLQPLPGPEARLNYQREQSQTDGLSGCPVIAQAFPDSCTDGQPQNLSFLVDSTYRLDFDRFTHDSLRLILRNWSPGYYNRLRTGALNSGTLEAIFFPAETPYSNVQGGLGLVLARAQTVRTFPTRP
ncbi:MAG: DUF4249 domain-containing protein [Bacteroidetes bacterium]|nr:MAG: DUF4249 domain-containing protein [Bacteroidota bacterium]